MADQVDFKLIGGIDIPPSEISKVQRTLSDLQKYAPKIFVNTNFGEAGKDVSQFTSYLDRANQRVISFTSSVSVLYTTIKIFKDIVSSTLEVDKALTSINSTMKLSSGNLDRFSKDLFDAARATSSSFEDAAAAAQSFARQGLSVEETLKRTKDALTLSKIAGIDAAESVRELTEAVNIFQKSGVTTTDVVKALSSVSSNFAISTKDVSDAFTRFGAVAQQAGLSFNQTIALITAVRQTSQREGAAIGTALTSIFEKLQPKDAIESLNRLGIAVRNSSGGLLPTIGIVENLAKSYDSLGNAQKAQIDKMVGGARQIEILKAGIIQLADANGTYSQASKILASGADDVTTRLNAQNQSISALLANFGTAAKQIQSNIGQLTFAPLLKGALGDGGDGNPITKALEDASGHADTAGGKIAEGLLRGIGDGLIYGLAPILLAAAAKVTSSTFGALFRDIGDQAGISKQTAEQQAMSEAAKEQASLQQQIVQLYKAGGEELDIALSKMTSLTERAALLQGILAKGGIASAALEATAATDAEAVIGLRGAAGGYLSVGSEAAAIAAGVGGAPSNAHAVIIPNFRYGPGQTGPIVANSSEYLVNLGAGDAIYNQDMVKTLGLPSNAQKIGAAGGYIPGDLRLGLGAAAQQGGAGDFGLQAEGLTELNTLFETLSKAPNLDAAYKIGPAIIDFSSALDKLSSKRVLSDLAQQFNELARVEGIGVPKINAGNITNERRYNPSAVLRDADSGINRIRGAFEESSPYYRGVVGSSIDEAQAAFHAIGSGGRSLPPGPAFSPYVGPNYSQYSTPAGPPNRPGATAGLYSQLNGRLQGSNLGLAAAIGLPFAGGIVDEFGGAGGTVQGESVGALSGALKGAGAGVGAGLLVGQPLGGALIGGAIGGIKGFLDKMSQSFSELADEIATKNNAIKANYDKTAAVFNIQDQLKEAHANNADPETISRLLRNQASAAGEITDPRVKSLLTGGGFDPALRAQVLGGYDSQSESVNRAGGVAGAFNIARGSASVFNQLGFGGPGGITYGLGGVDDKAINAVAQQAGGVIANLKPDQIKTLQDLLTKGDFQGAADSVQRLGGVSPGQIALNRPTGLTDTNAFNATIKLGIQQALDSNKGTAFSEANDKAAQGAADLEGQLRKMAQTLQEAAKISESANQGFLKITEAIQKATIATTLQTKSDEIAQQGAFDQSNIRATFAGQASQVGLGSNASLLSILAKAGVQDQSLIAQVGGARSIGDFQALQERYKTTGGVPIGDASEAKDFQKALEEAVDKLTEISANEAISLKVAETTNTLLQIQNSNVQKSELLSRANYSPTALAQVQYSASVGNTGSNRGDRLQSLLSEQSQLSSLGLPETQDSFEYTSYLQTLRTRQTLAQLASNRLGRGVGTGSSDLSAAAEQLQNSGNENDQVLGGRILAAGGQHGLLDFNPTNAIDNVKSALGGSSASAFQQALGGIGLGSGEQIIATGLDKIAALISGTNSILLAANPSVAKTTGQRLDTSLTLVHTSSRSGKKPVFEEEEDDGTATPGKFDGLGGFGAGFSKAATDFSTGFDNLSTVGSQVAEGIVSSFNRAWDSFATGSERAGKAFKSFIAGITGDASKAFADQAFKGLFSLFGSTNADGSGGLTNAIANSFGSLFGGHAAGGPIGFAKGGQVPAMLTGGEFYVTPQAAKSIGYDKLGIINKGYAGGGLVQGGSGLKDDVPASLPQGSYILRKSAVQRYGAGNLQRLVNRRANGGRIGFDDGGDVDLSDSLGDISEYGGDLDSGDSSSFNIGSSIQDDQYGAASNAAASASPNLGSLYSGAFGVALKLLLGFLDKSPGLLDTAQTTSNANRIRNYDQNLFLNPQDAPSNVQGAGGVKGGSAFLQADGNGGYRVINYGGQAVSATNYSGQSEGGPILSMPGYTSGGGVGIAPVPSSGAGSSPNVGVQVTIHNYGNGNTSATTNTSGGQGDLQSAAFAKQLGEQMKSVANQAIIDAQRSGGLLTQKARFAPSTQQG